MRPVDGVTLDEAAHICGCSRRTLVRHIDAGRLPAGPKHERRRVSRAYAEALALQLPSSRLAFDPESSYWVGASQAAILLGVNVSRLNQTGSRWPCPVRGPRRRSPHLPARTVAYGRQRPRGQVALEALRQSAIDSLPSCSAEH
ncbi:MAG: helix-turn-helix domain-containing protein [Nocardioidaceae bacterium]|nr:helix-turn-helix domain-containing protein [Nocardioidaceae bacterium]